MQYKYYLLGETVPVRVIFNDKGYEIGAEVPDPQGGKELIKDARYLSRIERSEEVDEITKEDFENRCASLFQRGMKL